ncbi:MAG TPA: hypothetical protein VJ892_04485, partial [Candidatus Absconditabacterales bacterium]|nr:hypothetical protein [Candidatus Absconditabacterales bacterium]
MNGPEKLKIEKLDQKDLKPGKELQDHDLVNYFDDKFFQDLKNGNCKIKKHNNLYIFEQKDINSLELDDNGDYIKKFCVKENVLKNYLKEKQKTEEIALESDSLLSEFLTTINTKYELNELEGELKTNNENLGESPEQLTLEINNLIDRFQKNRKRPRATKLQDNRYSRVRFKQVIKDDLASLRSIKRELNNYNYTTNIDYFVDYIEEMKSHKEQLEKVRQIITTGGNTAEIPAILDSIGDVRKEELFQNIAAEYNFEFNKIMKNATLNKLWNKDAEGFQKYLKNVRSGDIQNPSQNEFYEKHKKDFEEIMKKDPALYMDITTKRKRYYNYEYASSGYNNHYNNHPEVCRKKKGVFEKSGEFIADKLEDMGWIKNEKQKEAVKKLGKFAMIGTAIFLGFKLIKNLFPGKNKKRDWGAIAGRGGGLFALFNIDKVTNFGKDLFNIDGKKQTVDTKTTAEKMSVEEENVEQYVKPQYTTVATLGGIPINTLIEGDFLTEKNGKFQIDYDSYKNYIESSDMDKDKEELILENLEIIKDDNDMLNNGLNSFGVNNLDDLKDIAGNDNEKTLLDSNKTNEYINNVTSGVNMKLNEEGFEPKNSKAWYEMTQEYDK